ncbi:MAG TPA: nitrite reductase large subunit NirB, partial [Pirellulales bacterium]|nr:nitrite reductase large subunit NirB [Pirellulales bacterium]
IGNGMVGHRFCEKLVEFDQFHQYKIVTFCEEPRAAYDRVGLTSFFAHRDAQKLMLARLDWYRDNGIDLNIGDRANKIDRKRRRVTSDRGREIPYDFVVLATGSYPFVPQVPGIKQLGVFVYRTIDDLERIIAYGEKVNRAAVIGGGLLGLEAAKACYDLGLETHVVEFAPRLMPRQIDETGSKLLVEKIERLGVHVHLNKSTKEVLGHGAVEGLVFNDDARLDVQMIVVSAGIRPRDELARDCGLTVGERGGVVVDDFLETSDPQVLAIGEVAAHRGMVYGLVAPGYEMAETAAANLCGEERTFTGADMSTKLKLMGVDVASFGQHEAPAEVARGLVYEDPFGGVYKKLLFSHDGTRLVGGVLVGDAADYGRLLALTKSGQPLPVPPGELILGKKDAAAASASLDDACQVCSCNNVSKGQICQAIREKGLADLGAVKACTKAGTGCGGCVPLVSDLLAAELKAAGKAVSKRLCEHFAYTRQELFEIVKIRGIKTFADLIAGHGQGHGCEICKPAVASILASLWNDDVLAPPHQTLQDTNDRYLANVQRDGSYSVVPRVPGGEITPEKLIVLGQVARKFGLYSKITGGQRVDLFGAKLHELPDIWEDLVKAGFESGHAYGKALRTVKSCVGSTWCRYGVQDSVGFAIRVEERYRGIRAPHKIKAAVSGCVRECAEAQGKDFGLIATEKGYNLYVCGNGGAKPRHAELLAADLDEDTAIKLIDRFLMYYIHTADRLTRTSVWLEKMEGGIDHLRSMIIDDKLGICDELERQIQFLVDSYRCEWAEVVGDPEKRRWFKQFVNTDETEPGIEFVSERGQARPADWPKDFVPLERVKLNGNGVRQPGVAEPVRVPAVNGGNGQTSHEVGYGPAGPTDTSWVKVGRVNDFPLEGGAAVKYGKCQLAVFQFASRGEWYATQNMCPHKRAFVLSRGIIGDQAGAPKVACPLHKKTFALETGDCLSGEDYSIRVFPVKVEDGDVYLELPPRHELDLELATDLHAIRGCHDLSPAGCLPLTTVACDAGAPAV